MPRSPSCGAPAWHQTKPESGADVAAPSGGRAGGPVRGSRVRPPGAACDSSDGCRRDRCSTRWWPRRLSPTVGRSFVDLHATGRSDGRAAVRRHGTAWTWGHQARVPSLPVTANLRCGPRPAAQTLATSACRLLARVTTGASVPVDEVMTAPDGRSKSRNGPLGHRSPSPRTADPRRPGGDPVAAFAAQQDRRPPQCVDLRTHLPPSGWRRQVCARCTQVRRWRRCCTTRRSPDSPQSRPRHWTRRERGRW